MLHRIARIFDPLSRSLRPARKTYPAAPRATAPPELSHTGQERPHRAERTLWPAMYGIDLEPSAPRDAEATA